MTTEAFGRGTKKPLPNLRRARKARGLSLRELDKLSDVHHATISRIENGGTSTRDTIRRLARALKVTPEELMTEEVANKPSTPLEDDAREAEDRYIGRLALGNEAYDEGYEENVVEAYLRIVDAEGRTDEVIRRMIQWALNTGKSRGKELA